MNTVPIQRPWIREGEGRRLSVEIRRPMIVVATIVAVFACFFALGRATDAGTTSQVESLPVAPVSASVPVSLTSTPPLDIVSLVSSRPRQSKSNSAGAVSASGQAFSGQASRSPLSPSQLAPSASQPAPAPEKAAAPVQATPSVQVAPPVSRPAPSTSSAPTQGQSSHAPQSSSGSSSGGGSFDSSA